MNHEIKIIFRNGYTELDEIEMPMKGYRNDVEVHFPDDSIFIFCFYDDVRLSQDIVDEKCIIEENLIVVQELTKDNIEQIAKELWTTGLLKKYKAKANNY